MGHGFALLRWLDKLVEVGTYTEEEMKEAKREWGEQEHEEALEENGKRSKEGKEESSS